MFQITVNEEGISQYMSTLKASLKNFVYASFAGIKPVKKVSFLILEVEIDVNHPSSHKLLPLTTFKG